MLWSITIWQFEARSQEFPSGSPVGKRCRVNIYGERSAEPRFAGNLESDLVSHFVIVVVVRNPSTVEFSM